MATMTDNRTEVIAAQNDKVRAVLNSGLGFLGCAEGGVKFKLVWTPGIDEAFMQTGRAKTVLSAVADFDDFTEDNNPHGEREFAALDIEGTRIFFKIDYYNLTLDGGSEDPADTAQTMRVLTLMLPAEY